MKKLGQLLIPLLLVSTTFWGCQVKPSYPGDKLKRSIAEICRKEYDIHHVDVRVVGKTVGVYLPLNKLFAADFKEAAMKGKVRNLETLFEPSPEALEKVEDVLFTISRVLLSTDRELDFYNLQATDTDTTGMQLVLTGFVNDVRRVRIWDISRDEYRKRIIHELRMNRAVVWHKPVREFFRDLAGLTIDQIRDKYFNGKVPNEALQTLFMNQLLEESYANSLTSWEILDLRSTMVQRNQVLVYVKTRPVFEGTDPVEYGEELQYLFMLSVREDRAGIERIIPFQYRDQDGVVHSIPFPKELQIEQNVESWEQEFKVTEFKLGPFLAEQMTRRVQNLIMVDERIRNTFREVKLTFTYHEDAEPSYFSLTFDGALKEFNNYSRESLIFHEDMLHLLSIASREFVSVTRSYSFGDFDHLSLEVAQESFAWVIGRDDLESFRRNKVDLQGLITVPTL